MEINLKDLSTGFDTSNNNNLVKILENKIMIYQKENQALKNKIRILQDDNDDKSLKIQEQLNHLSNLENDNNSLKKLYDNSKKKFNDETIIFYNARQEQDKEINNMKLIIEELKMENEKLSKSVILQRNENANLQKNLNKTLSENKLYSQDNTILLSKVKEYEDNLLMHNSNSNNNLNQNNSYKVDIKNNNNPNNNEFIVTTNNMYENKMALYSSIINDEINLIAKYIDTYFNLNNYISDANINIPQLQSISNFPRDNKLSSFTNIINSVENALKRICMQNKFNKSNEYVLKQEINKLNNVLEKKNNENIELKKDMSDLKRKYFYLKNDFDKLNNDLSSQKGFNKQIQNTMNDISNGNDDYLKGLYQSIKSELDKILNDPLFHSYLNVIIEQRNNYNSNTHNTYMSNGMKYLFEDTLDKYILVSNCIVDDYKKQRSDNNCGICGNDMGGNTSNVRELESTIDDLNNKLIQKDKIISNNKDEKKLLINQINILQRDIMNLRNKSLVSPQKVDNKLLSYNYVGNNINTDLNNKYSSVPIFPRKDLYLTGNNNLNNNMNRINDIIYTQPYIENNNKYLNDINNLNLNYDIQNIGDNNNIINQQYNNNQNTNFDYNNDNVNNMNINNINNNYNNNNINNMDNNNEELKDNENEEEEEENELYFEGQPFPHQKSKSSDLNMNDKNIGNMQNEYNMNSFGNNNYEQQYNDYSNNEENENENYNEEDFMYNNNNQFQEIIEEEENKNNTLEGDSNKNMSSSKKNSNVNSHKNSNINSDLNYNINKNQNMNDNNLKNINLNNNYVNSEEEYVNDEQANDEMANQEQPQVQSNKSENIQGIDNEGNNN